MLHVFIQDTPNGSFYNH